MKPNTNLKALHISILLQKETETNFRCKSNTNSETSDYITTARPFFHSGFFLLLHVIRFSKTVCSFRFSYFSTLVLNLAFFPFETEGYSVPLFKKKKKQSRLEPITSHMQIIRGSCGKWKVQPHNLRLLYIFIHSLLFSINNTSNNPIEMTRSSGSHETWVTEMSCRRNTKRSSFSWRILLMSPFCAIRSLKEHF